MTIPSSVTFIDEYAFSDCSGLTEIVVDSANGSYASEDGILYNKAKTELKQCPDGKAGSAKIASSVTRVSLEAFLTCRCLAEIVVDSRNQTYASEDGVLYNKAKTELIRCPGGKQGSVTIPSSVTDVDGLAFDYCNGVTEIVVDSRNQTYASEDGILYNKAKTELIRCPGGKQGSLEIPSGVTSIENCAFSFCRGLTAVTIPEGVMHIAGQNWGFVGAFYDCRGLTSVTIPSSAMSIGTGAFRGCLSLKMIRVSNNGDIDDVKRMLRASGFDIESVAFDHVRFEVLFAPCGGTSEVASIGVYEGTAAGELPMATRAGYEFLGWFTAAVGGTQVTAETVVTKDVTFYAHWKHMSSGGAIVPGEKVTIDTGLVGYTVSGLPKGLSYSKTTGKITGSASKPTAAEGVVVKFTKKGCETEELTIVVTAIPKVTVRMEGVNSPGDTDGCKVTGAGAYLVGKKVTLKATVPKGTVFMGWAAAGDGGSTEEIVSKNATYVFTMGKEDVALAARFKKEVMMVGCEALSSKESFPAGVLCAEEGIALDIATESGVKSIKVDKLPTGMKYDTKTGLITGAPTKAGDNKVVITVTAKSGAVAKKEIEVKVAAMPVTAVGTFMLTTTDAGKLTAKVVTAAGTVSFSGTCWDAVEDSVYRATLTTKKGENLVLTLDSTAGWDENQLVGSCSFVGGRTLDVTAQRNAFGKTWYFAAEGNEKTGWKFAYTDDTKGAAFTVTLKADGSTSIAGKLPNGTDAKGKAVTIKVSASGYANVGGLKDGAMLADFAPILTVKKVKTVLAIKTNLWFDRLNTHSEGVGHAKLVR